MSPWDRLDADHRKRMLDGDVALARLKRHEGIERYQIRRMYGGNP